MSHCSSLVAAGTLSRMLADAGRTKQLFLLEPQFPMSFLPLYTTLSSRILSGHFTLLSQEKSIIRIRHLLYSESPSVFATSFDTCKELRALPCKKFHQISKAYSPAKNEVQMNRTRRMVPPVPVNVEATGTCQEMISSMGMMM